jgi:hypothetical protein
MSLFCSASMLPCGRYYYEPEGGYVGNPWVKFSYQYIYLYLAWIIHHLDLLDHYLFQFFQIFIKKSLRLYKKNLYLVSFNTNAFINYKKNPQKYLNLILINKNN